MLNRKYNQFATRGHINVSSSGHYFIDIFCGRSGRGDTFHFCLNDNQFLRSGDIPGSLKMPKYVIEATVQAIAQGIQSGHIRFYEVDREGNRRFDNLRYYDKEMVDLWLMRA